MKAVIFISLLNTTLFKALPSKVGDKKLVRFLNFTCKSPKRLTASTFHFINDAINYRIKTGHNVVLLYTNLHFYFKRNVNLL